MDEPEQKSRLAKVYDALKNRVGCAIVVPNANASVEAIATGAKGTVSFIQTPDRRLLVTCAHVWDTFLAARALNPAAQLVVLGATGHESFAISDAIEIDKDGKHLDIVTLHLPTDAGRVEECGKRFFEAAFWPSPVVAKGDTVIAVGYPGQHQIPDADASAMLGQPVVNLRPTVLTLTVSSSSTRHFVLAENDDDNPRQEIAFDNSLAELKSLGGASGAAYYRYTDGTTTFGGIQYEAHGETAVDSAILVSHAAFIRADGMIHRSGPPFI